MIPLAGHALRPDGTALRRWSCLLALAGTLGGCGAADGGGLRTGTSIIGEEKGQQYAFSRARVPILIEGAVAPKRLSISTAPAYTHKVTVSVGRPKYAVDSGLAKALSLKPDDRFVAEIDANRQLRSVLPITIANAPAGGAAAAAPVVAGPAAAGAEIADLGALLEKALPAGPAVSALSRVLPHKLPPFRIDTEIDPTAPGEIEGLQAELARVATDWELRVAFEPVTVSATVGERRLALAAGSGHARCGDPICFRVPVPYRIRVEPAASGWRGKLEAHVWLPNNGPLGSLDVRNPLFVASGARATFENGMLKSIRASDAKALATLLKVPAEPQTADARR